MGFFGRAIAAVVMFGGALASGQALAAPTFEMNSGHDVCTVAFLKHKYPSGESMLALAHPCEGKFRDLVAYRSRNRGQQFTLYINYGGRFQEVGTVTRQQKGVYAGDLSDGTGLTMVNLDNSQGGYRQNHNARRNNGWNDNRGRGAAAPAKPGAVAGNCLVHYNTNRCARAGETGEPDTSFGKTAPIRTLARLNLRFLPGTSSTKTGTLERGQCVNVTNCRKDFDGSLWCETRIANRTSWFIKEDDRNLYAKNGC